jgi:hypothetical protein
LGIINSSLLHPNLAAPLARLLGRPHGWTPLRSKHLPALVLTEAITGLLVVFATGLLTSSAPAHGPQFATASATQPGAITLTKPAGDLQVSVAAQPNQPGANVITIRIDGSASAATGEIMRVITHFTYTGQDIGAVETDANPVEPGVYQVSGTQLSIAGPWQVEIVVRRKGMEDSSATFNWVVSAGVQPAVTSNGLLEPWLTLAAILFLATATGIGALVWWRRRSSRAAVATQAPRMENPFADQLNSLERR